MMKAHLVVFGFVVVFLALFVRNANSILASSHADCESFGTDDPVFTPVTINFTCTSAATAYFGVCDSGPALDDFFELVYGGSVVAYNSISGSSELLTIGSASTTAGANTATINRTAGGGTATYSYGISTDRSAVESYLSSSCGTDYTAPTGCNGTVAVFTEDTAPSAGTLEFHMLLGNEGARTDEQVIKQWDIAEGQQINNALVEGLASPRYARVWWQPAGSDEWYFLPSQYYIDGSSTASEYGIACGSAQPSYHTSFSNAILESNVCFNLLQGCESFFNASNQLNETSTPPIPTVTPTATSTLTPTPTATATAVLPNEIDWFFTVVSCQYADDGINWRCRVDITPYLVGTDEAGDFTVQVYDNAPNDPQTYQGAGPFTHIVQAPRCLAYNHIVQIVDNVSGVELSESMTIDPNESFEDGCEEVVENRPDVEIKFDDEGKLLVGPIGFGTTEIVYPESAILNETATIDLSIELSPEVASLIPISSPEDINLLGLDDDERIVANQTLGVDSVLEYETEYGVIDIYPVMGAKVEGTGFEIVPQSMQIQEYDPNRQNPLIWTWTVTPRESGRKTLLLTIFIPVLKDEQIEVKRTLQNFSIHLDVQPPTPPAVPEAAQTAVSEPTPTAIPEPRIDITSGGGILIICGSASLILFVFALLRLRGPSRFRSG